MADHSLPKTRGNNKTIFQFYDQIVVKIITEASYNKKKNYSAVLRKKSVFKLLQPHLQVSCNLTLSTTYI